MWVCDRCGANNEREACWRCRAARPEGADGRPGEAGGAASTPAPGMSAGPVPPPPAGPPPAWVTAGLPPAAPAAWPSWPPPSPARRGGLGGATVAAIVLAVVLAVGVGGLLLARSVLRLGQPTVALAAPSTIAGLPRTADFSTQGVSVLGTRVATVASASYGAGDIHYAVVAISANAVVGDRRTLVQALNPDVSGAPGVEAGPAEHIVRSGVDFTCSRLTGVTAGAICDWSDSGVVGVVVQTGSAAADRCADFADAARRALAAG